MPSREKTAGFSVVEVLIASAIFLIIAVGLLPLFASSISNNLQGRESTDVTNFARSRIEEYVQLSFDSPRLVVPAGADELVLDQYWDPEAKQWLDGLPPTGFATPWLRQTTIRQYNITDLGTPLDGDSPPGVVNLKEVVVEVRSNRTNFGGGKKILMRVLKAA